MSPVNGTIIFSLILAFVYFFGIVSFLTDYETGKCEMTYMFEYPQFVRISNDADLKYRKYGLYAYSEGRLTEKARSMVFDGIPVLFIPGSGGSHKQCRSFASIALRKALNSRTRFHFDYFTVDLNNELSGLNGALLPGQFDYVKTCMTRILDLYKNQRDPQKSIILIGHSMGGTLAKAIVAELPSDSQLVPIVITLSAPLTRPVLALDPYFERFYSKMNDNFTLPTNTSFISLAGGFNDFMVPAHITSSGNLHAVVTHVPKCWVSTDHLSIVWCKQLVLAINRALFESVDAQIKKVLMNRDYVTSVFHHHLIHHPGIKTDERYRYTKEVQLTHNGDWHATIHRQYSVRLPKGTREVLWYLVPLVMQPQHEFLTLVALNMKNVDWVYVCPAVSIRNDQRFCENGHHLTHLSEISPSVRYKRRTLRINMHDLKMNYTTATHVAFRAMPTSEFLAFHVDVTNPEGRKIVYDQGASWITLSPKELIRQTDEKAIHYEIILPAFQQVIQSYTLYLDGVCSGQGHHATATLKVPWNHHDLHKYYTDALQEPMTFRLYRPRPANTSESAYIQLTLDPTCRYRVSIVGSYDLSMLARYYSPMLVANIAAVILMTLRAQLRHIDSNQRCSFLFSALKEGAKPYYVVTTVKLFGRLFMSGVYFIGPSDSHVIVEENMDVLLLPLILYSVSVGIVWLASFGLSLSLIFFESTFHKLGVKFFAKTFAGRAGWADHVLKAFDKVPGVVACVLITMSYTTCGGLAVCLATVFYFLKLTQMAQDLIEGMVKTVAKLIALKLKDTFWHRIKQRLFGGKKKQSNRSEAAITDGTTDNPALGASETDRDEGHESALEQDSGSASASTSDEKQDGEDTDFERPMLFEVQGSGNSEVKKVNGRQLVAMLASDMDPEKSNPSDTSFFSLDLSWIKEAIENNEIFFHFTIFLLYLIVAVLNIPSVLTWARNYRYSKSLEPDPVFVPALILTACAAPLWQMEFPVVERRYFREVSMLVYGAGIMVLVFGLISIYRISFILAGVVAIVTLHQIIAPNKPPEEVEDHAGDDPSVENAPPGAESAETDSYGERVKSKWE